LGQRHRLRPCHAIDGTVAATLDFRETCKPCRAPPEATGWIYVQGYAVLKN